jgi:hypothetical protein
MIHPQFIAAGQDSWWSGTRVHNRQVELYPPTVRVPGPFIENSSRLVKMKMARHLHLAFSWGSGAGSLGPASRFLFPHRPFPEMPDL